VILQFRFLNNTPDTTLISTRTHDTLHSCHLSQSDRPYNTTQRAQILQTPHIVQFLGAFAKLQKAATNFLVSLSVHMEQPGSYWMDSHET
jgi:hypothetical protein